MHNPSARLREPRLRPQGGHHAHPLCPPQGTRRSVTGGHSPAPPLPASGNHDCGLRGVTMHTPSARLREPRLRPQGGHHAHPSTRLREPRLRPQGGHHAHPLCPPQGTRRSVTGGHSPAPPLPASGNHDSGLRGVTMHTPSAWLREPRRRSQGATLLHPLYPPQGTTTPASGGLPCTPPLPASGNQTLGHRGPLSCTPSTRLREPRLRPQGGHHAQPLCPTQGTTTPASGGSPCTAPLPASGNQTLGHRGPLSCTPSTRLREPRLRPQGGHHAQPLYPTQGTRRSVTGGHSPAPPLPASGNHDSGLRGVTMHTPSTRLREPDARSQGATLLHPLYPPQGTTTPASGGSPCTPPLPASGNHDSGNHDCGLRGVTMHTPSTRLREPRLRPQGGHHAHPLCPPQGTTTPAWGGHSPAPPLPASGNHDSGLRGVTMHTPSARLREPRLRPQGGHHAHPLCPPQGTTTPAWGGHSPAPPLPASNSLLPGRLSSESPPTTSRRDPHPSTSRTRASHT